jgi:hypothetical protein
VGGQDRAHQQDQVFQQVPRKFKNFPNLALFWVKNANFFAEFFGVNIKKIITSVPGLSFILSKTMLRSLWLEVSYKG